jgi:hypothetical protein
MRNNDLYSFTDFLPMYLSVNGVLIVFTVLTVPINPFAMPWALNPPPQKYADADTLIYPVTLPPENIIRYLFEGAGLASIILYAIIITAIIVPLLVRFINLPSGSLLFTIFLYLTIIALITHNFFLVPGVVISALLVELLRKRLAPSAGKLIETGVFACLTNFTIFFFYILSIVLFESTYWQVHMIAGTPILGALIGLFTSIPLTNTYKAAP